MLASNPFAQLSASVSPTLMQAFVAVMALLVVVGTITDMVHKGSAAYFFNNMAKARSRATRPVSKGQKIGIAAKTLVVDVMASGEFCNQKRRIAHLLGMYGFVIYAAATAVMVFYYATPASPAPAYWPLAWHIGALMVVVGGMWFWFFIRADVSAEGRSPFRFMQADLFVVSLVLSVLFGLAWSFAQSAGMAMWAWVFLGFYLLATTVLFASVPWSKFAHMFFKPAAAFQKRVIKADGSRENMPEDYDLTDPAVQAKYPDIPTYMGKNPADMGLGIKRESPRHY